jgi:hypothetical protein
MERTVHLAVRLSRGEKLTATQVARQYGVSRQTSYRMLGRIGRIVPVYNDNGIWRVLECLRG